MHYLPIMRPAHAALAAYWKLMR